MSFTDDEIAYLTAQPLARIATVDDDGQPDVVPVGFQFDGTHIIIGGYDPTHTRRHRNVDAGHLNVALIVDDLVSTRPWTPRFLRIYGTAAIVDTPQPHLRITPVTSWSWNLDGEPLSPSGPRTPPIRTDHTQDMS